MNKKVSVTALSIVLSICILCTSCNLKNEALQDLACAVENESTYIKWVEFSPSCKILKKALDYDIGTYSTDAHVSWIVLLSYTAAKCGGEFSSKSYKDMDAFIARIKNGESASDITSGMRYFAYYLEAYTAILGGFVGEYRIEKDDGRGGKTAVDTYGLKVFSPIAKGYNFGHYKDYGMERTYGYKRLHLGNDLMGSIGTPIIAIEGGTVESLGWNRYGGWRMGIRSADKRRYYYYAHMRKNHPYVKTLKEGDTVQSGDVIGYMGMTGYSIKENVNNLKKPHLHLGLQLIFDESQKEGENQIWIDVYELVEFLQINKSAVEKNEITGDYQRVYSFIP